MITVSSVSLQEKDKNRCNIFVDNAFFCSLSFECVVKYSVKTGAVFEESDFEKIKMEDETQTALLKAKKYISKSLKTKMQLILYLKEKGVNGKVIYEVVEKMLEYGYVNDVEYARIFLENNSMLGKRLADYKLIQKGVKKEDIEKAREMIVDNSVDCCARLAEKRLRNKEISKELIQKTYKYLIGRGFSYEEAEKAVSKYLEELGEI